MEGWKGQVEECHLWNIILLGLRLEVETIKANYDECHEKALSTNGKKFINDGNMFIIIYFFNIITTPLKIKWMVNKIKNNVGFIVAFIIL